MLQKIKCQSRKPVNNVIALLLILLSAPLYAQYSGGIAIDKIVAKVDNYIVLKSDLEDAYQQSLAMRQQTGITPTRCQVLEQLVTEKLMLAKAEIDSVTVGEERVTLELDRRLQYMVNSYGEENIEEQFGKSIEEFREELRDDIRNQLVVQEMQGKITENVEVTPAEIKSFFNKIPEDSLPYYSTEVTVAQIVKKPTVSQAQKEETRKRLLEIRNRILNGESFAELAKEYSEDPGSAVKGGELGFVDRGQFVPEFEAAAMKMQPGELSQPIESPFGFHLIQLIERRGNRYNSRHILLKPNSSELDIKYAEEFLDSLRTQILADSITFAKAAKEFSDDKETAASGGFFLSADGSNRVPTEELDPVIFFTLDTMKVGTITEPIAYRMDDGTPAVRIFYYKDRTQPHRANLKDDYQKIYHAATQEKKSRALSEWFENAQKQVYIEVDPQYNHCSIGSTI